MAMVSREAAQGKSARSSSTNPLPIEPSRGERHDIAHVGGRSQAEQRLGEAAAILKISRRRKAMYGGAFQKLEIMSVLGVEVTTVPYPADLP
jgi:hypothetical protein